MGRRLTRRAIDLLVVAFLVMVGLSTGQQLIEWWRVDPASTPDLSDLNPVDLDWSRTPVTLRFGDAPTSLERIPFVGGRKQLEEELIRIGQSIVTTAEIVRSPMDEAERGWLKALQSAAPVFWDSTRGNVYRRHEPLPSFVATRFTEPADATDAANDTDAATPRAAAAAAETTTVTNFVDVADAEPVVQRIVGWGLAFPVVPGQWTIYVFRPDLAKSVPGDSPAAFALPPAARNITSLRGSDGCQWRVIQGRGDIAGWVQHFDRQFGTDALVSRTVDERTANLKYRRERTMTDVQLRREHDDSLTGVIWSARERESR